MNRYLLIILLTSAIIFDACKKENIVPQAKIQIAFTTDSMTLDQSKTDSIKITLSVSDTIREPATVTLMIENNAEGSPGDIVSDPAYTDGNKLVLNLEPGSTSASFKVSAANSTISGKVVVFKILEVTGDIIPEQEASTLKLGIVKDLNAIPAVFVSTNKLEDFGTVDHGKSSIAKSYTIKGNNLTDDIIAVAPINFEVSIDNQDFKDSVKVDFQNANVEERTIYVRFSPNSGKNIALTGNIRNYSARATDKIIEVSGTEGANKENDLLLNEDFDYGKVGGDLTSVSSWVNYSGTTNPIQFSPEGLDFTNYEVGGESGAITFQNGSGSREDVTRNFNEISTGSVYLAQLVNLTAASFSDNGDFFLALRDAKGGYFSRVYAKKNEQGKLLFGAAKTRSGSEPVMFASTLFDFNKTYLVVIKYDLDLKSASLYVLEGSFPTVEPTPDLVTNTGSDASSLLNIVIRQSSDAIAGKLDGVRVSKTWGALKIE